MLSLDAGSRGLVLTQLNVPGFADSPWKALCFLRNEWVWGKVCESGRKVGKRNHSWYGKMNKKFKIKKKNIYRLGFLQHEELY